MYKIQCPRCNVCYVDLTRRYLKLRFKDHPSSDPVSEHLKQCGNATAPEDVSVLGMSPRRETHNLQTNEALWMRYLTPHLNT